MTESYFPLTGPSTPTSSSSPIRRSDHGVPTLTHVKVPGGSPLPPSPSSSVPTPKEDKSNRGGESRPVRDIRRGFLPPIPLGCPTPTPWIRHRVGRDGVGKGSSIIEVDTKQEASYRHHPLYETHRIDDRGRTDPQPPTEKWRGEEKEELPWSVPRTELLRGPNTPVSTTGVITVILVPDTGSL